MNNEGGEYYMKEQGLFADKTDALHLAGAAAMHQMGGVVPGGRIHCLQGHEDIIRTGFQEGARETYHHGAVMDDSGDLSN